MKNAEKVKQGKRNRAMGADFERRVRKDLEEKGWIVDKWSNTVDLSHRTTIENTATGDITQTQGKLIPAKRKYAGPGRPLVIGTGFPDFIAFKTRRHIISFDGATPEEMKAFKDKWNAITDKTPNETIIHSSNARVTPDIEMIAVECKTNGYLDKVEKLKCKWLLDNNIFSKILIASKHKIKNRVHIEYKEWHPGNECHKIN